MNKEKISIGFLTTYLPRECGIATYTQNLENAIKQLNLDVSIKIIAISDENYHYPKQVIWDIDPLNKQSYIEAAEFINRSNLDIISVQHEFWILDNEYLLLLLKKLNKPVVITFHTVPIHQKEPFLILPRRYKSRTKFIKKISHFVDKILVMADLSKDYLSNSLKIDKTKIKVIPHGAPKISLKTIKMYSKLKTNLGFKKNDFVISTFGLITHKKGLEYVIKAMPSIIKNNPKTNIVYLIAGRMHPKKPPIYLSNLKKLVKKLKLDNNVIFDSRYLEYVEIYKYLSNTDIFITPYYVKELASSGTVSYAIATGRCIVSTPYIFAREIVKKKNLGELVEFKDSESIERTISKLIIDQKLLNKYKHNSYQFSKTITWDKIAQKYVDLFRKILE